MKIHPGVFTTLLGSIIVASVSAVTTELRGAGRLHIRLVEDEQIPLPSDFPSMTPSFAPTTSIKECEDNSNVWFVVTIPSNATTILGQCSDISENNWQDDLCSLSNQRVVVDNGVALYSICGYECQDLSGCGLPVQE
jgi:hypothetical protein